MSSKLTSQKKSSYTVFSEIDALVSKPVLGSDGAASWQEFQKQSVSSNDGGGEGGGGYSTSLIARSRGTAPHMPVKRADRLGSGFHSIADERAHETKVREEAGDASLGSGYTVFKRRRGKDEDAAQAEEKRTKMIVERVRPEGAIYFIKADTFDGWKEDYVFTTKVGRGSGYYWDGMDSAKKLLLTGDNNADDDAYTNANTNAEYLHVKRQKKKKKTKKSKKTKKNESATPSTTTTLTEQLHQPSDSNNPMEQVQNALRRRNEILSKPPAVLGLNPTTTTSIQSEHERTEMNALTATTSLGIIPTVTDNPPSSSSPLSSHTIGADMASQGWEMSTDPVSGKSYYFNRSTGERRWDDPLPHDKSSASSSPPPLPDGWNKAKDSKSGRDYYYHHASKKTSWDRPI